jgi:hypothetical protein
MPADGISLPSMNERSGREIAAEPQFREAARLLSHMEPNSVDVTSMIV